jgi:hypothetical protein
MRISLQFRVYLNVQHSYRRDEFFDHVIDMNRDCQVESALISDQMNKFVLRRREASVMSATSQLAFSVKSFQKTIIDLSTSLIDQNTDVI